MFKVLRELEMERFKGVLKELAIKDKEKEKELAVKDTIIMQERLVGCA